MRTWERVNNMEHCGGCGQTLKAGAPVQVVTADPSRKFSRPNQRWFRCVFCAEGVPPEDLPPLVSKTVPIKPMVHIPSGPGTLPLDFKEHREPGEDG